MSQEKEIVEEIKFWVKQAESDVYDLRNNVHPRNDLHLERAMSIIRFIQGLLNDLSNMLEEDS